MKYGNTHYYEAPRMFWPVAYEKVYDKGKKHNVYTTKPEDPYQKFHKLPVYTKWLYQTLKECEHRFTGKNNNDRYVSIYVNVDNPDGWFYVGIEKLSYMSGMSVTQIKRSKKELIAVGLIKTCVCHLIDKDTKQRTTVHVTGYRVYSEEELEMKNVWHD